MKYKNSPATIVVTNYETWRGALGEEKLMPHASLWDNVPLKIFGATISVLLAIIGILIVGAWVTVNGHLDKIENVGVGNTQAINDLRVQLVKSIGDVEKQTAITNTKLDDLIAATKKR